MTRDELLALLDKRAAQVKEARKLSCNLRTWNVTLDLACDDLDEGVKRCREGLLEGYATEEMVKATLMDRYTEFCRCRDVVQEQTQAEEQYGVPKGEKDG